MHDTGFSPNPFWGFCTLANCKPQIRRTAKLGDWIVGLSPKAKGNKIIYAMRVDEKLTYEEYFRDKRFASRIPDFGTGCIIHKCGDNIYQPIARGRFRQVQSMHSNGRRENAKTKAHDLGGENVLVSKNFHYFGSNAIELPRDLHPLKIGRAHRCHFSEEVIKRFLRFIAGQPRGVCAAPTMWSPDDASWKARKQSCKSC
jgi:hypothetical protein